MAEKITLTDQEPPISSTSDMLANTLVSRIGLMPRKSGATDAMHRVLLEFFERAKKANAQKDPKLAVMTVEEMAVYARITRQTMYEYLERWLMTDLIVKVSYIDAMHKVFVGYKLNGVTLDDAFDAFEKKVHRNVSQTRKLAVQLAKMLKNEKIAQTLKKNTLDTETKTEDVVQSVSG